MSRLSVAIIGAGNIAGGYDEKKQADDEGIYSHVGAYALHGGFELKTVFDLNQKRAEEFGCRWKAAKIASSLEDIQGAFHDVISVCTPDETHFDIVRNLMQARSCRTLFVEKPLATDTSQLEELANLAVQNDIRVVVNFQRRYEAEHRKLRERIASHSEELLSITAHYMKGLQHIGITMVDTLIYLCGQPNAVLAYNRVFNREVNGFSYEFVLYYPGFTVSAKSTDAERFNYNYHIFEIDLMFTDGRQTLIDNSQRIKLVPVTGYAYSGVKVLDERKVEYRDTGYRYSMNDAVGYVHDITVGKLPHDVNTTQSSFNNQYVIDSIIESFDKGAVKINLRQKPWKR